MRVSIPPFIPVMRFAFSVYYYMWWKMSVPSDRERLQRLETRAREAEVALRQLKNYVQLLKQKAGLPCITGDQ